MTAPVKRSPALGTLAALGVTAVTLLLVFASAQGAQAVRRGKLTTTVTPSGEFMTASYTFSQYKCDSNDTCVGFQATFPTGTDVTGATSVDGSVSVSSQTVTVIYTTPRSGNNTVLLARLAGIVNPAAGVYNVGDITFLMTSNPAQEPQPTGDYEIFAVPYLVLTIETPGAAQMVDFGPVDPGVTSVAQSVLVTVESSSPTTLTWSVSGDAAQMGLAVSGAQSRTQLPGVTVYDDSYTVTPPYTTPPSVPLTATVLYTVVM